MAIQINAFEDIIRIDKAFVSGKDRIHVNGEMLFEGKLVAGEPQTVSAQGAITRSRSARSEAWVPSRFI